MIWLVFRNKWFAVGWVLMICAGIGLRFGLTTYLLGGDPALTVPRRSAPRARVPGGSVALADTYSGVYPRPSPGGWQLIGRTEVRLWDLDARPPALLTPGTTVRFVPIGPA